MTSHNELGKRGEDLATEYLLEKGYKILNRNWRYSNSELDIIAQDGASLIVIEVKARSSNYFGYPEESVDEKKINFISRAVEEYISQIEWTSNVRFDIISILFSGNKVEELHHIIDAYSP